MGVIKGIHHGTRRAIKELTVDKADFIYRLFTGNLDLPPYSLREFVGGAKGFREVGPWFVEEFIRRGLVKQGSKILDVGCGCGRLAHSLATNPEMTKLGVQYTGMDIDSRSIEWCRKSIQSRNPQFSFYHVDMRSRTYNPEGKHEAKTYRFPHQDGSLDLIILTSVFTHLLEPEVDHYLAELSRIIKPGGAVYASFFTYKSKDEALSGVARRRQKFPFFHGRYALESEEFPENAVAFEENHLLGMVSSHGMKLRDEPALGLQDVFILSK